MNSNSIESSGREAKETSRHSRSEWRTILWAASWFFFVLLSYFTVRPVRETMGAIGGTKQLQGLMLVTFAVMLLAVPAYSFLVNRLPRRWLVRVVFHFFCVCLACFSAGLAFGSDFVQVWTARTFFVWVNVFALFSTSVFWSVLTDLLSSEQGKRLFGRIACGGTIGAIAGALLTSQIATRISTAGLLLVPIAAIQMGLWCAWRLELTVAKDRRLSSEGGETRDSEKLASGGLLEGITRVLRSPYLASICLFLLLAQSSGTQLYFQQAEIVRMQVEDDQEKTQLFAYIDFATQICTLVAQFLLSGVILRKLGVGIALMLLPLVYLCSFAALSQSESLSVLAVAMVAARACAYGITVPAREVLFTVVDREDRYKSKSFIDTVVLRGGDAVSGQLFGTLTNAMKLSFATINLWTLPVMGLWTFAAYRLGVRQRRLASTQAE